jgi:demethylmenaquinone methyltransferase/2-methoxy-6-polyprenyl-1,4-benzoquinol methylase
MRASTPIPGAPESGAVRAMFDRIAPRYDLVNRLLSAGVDLRWRRQAVAALEVEGPARVLDLCTGTADLLAEVLQRSAGSSGVGVDLSRGMLVRGAAKLRRQGLASRGWLLCGAAERLPFPDGVFTGALVGFGIRNLAGPAAGLGELHRVLRPGGRLVVLEFSRPRGLVAPAFRLYFRALLPRLAGLLSDASAYAYLPASVARFLSPEALAELLRDAGFQRVAWRPLSAGIACLHLGDKAG